MNSSQWRLGRNIYNFKLNRLADYKSKLDPQIGYTDGTKQPDSLNLSLPHTYSLPPLLVHAALVFSPLQELVMLGVASASKQ